MDRQDRQAVEGHAAQAGQLVLLRIGQQLFIGLLGLLPGVLEGIGPPQGNVEVFDLRFRQHALHPRLVLLEQGARLCVAPDGIFNGKDSQRLIPGLHTVASGHLSLTGGQRMIGQRTGRSAFGLQQGQGALV